MQGAVRGQGRGLGEEREQEAGRRLRGAGLPVRRLRRPRHRELGGRTPRGVVTPARDFARSGAASAELP